MTGCNPVLTRDQGFILHMNLHRTEMQRESMAELKVLCDLLDLEPFLMQGDEYSARGAKAYVGSEENWERILYIPNASGCASIHFTSGLSLHSETVHGIVCDDMDCVFVGDGYQWEI